MPGPILHLGAVYLCAHGGQGTPLTPQPRVLVSGQPILTMTTTFAVAGCPFAPPPGNGPCVTAQFTIGAARVFSMATPVLTQAGVSICTPTGTPLAPPAGVQPRVIAM